MVFTLFVVTAMLSGAAAIQPPDAASVVARCAEAMGGRAAIESLRSLRVEVVYPDHGEAPISHEVRRPHQFRTESEGRYVLVFDGSRASYRDLDPAKTGRSPVSLPPEQLADLDVDIAWLVPAFFDYPSEYLGTDRSRGVLCHKLAVSLPLGARAVYFLDASTNLVRTIAVDVTLGGKPFHAERDWVDYRVVQGIRYPGGMTYAGRDKTTRTAVIRSVVFNPALDEARFRVPEGK